MVKGGWPTFLLVVEIFLWLVTAAFVVGSLGIMWVGTYAESQEQASQHDWIFLPAMFTASITGSTALMLAMKRID